MSESKGKIIFSILAVLLLLFGGGVTLYPFLNGLWVEYTMHKDSEEFLLLLEDSPEETKGGVSYVIAEEPEKEKGTVPEQYPQLWLDMKAYNEAIFREGQEGLSDPAAYETPSFLLSDYGLNSEVFGVLSIPRLELRKQQKERILQQEDRSILDSTEQLLETIEAGPEVLEAFDEELFCELIDKIIVESNVRIRFRLKNGLELPETMERTVR